MKVQKAELTAAVDAMEAELAVLKLQQMESKYQTDDSRMAKIKEDLRKLKTKVDVEREKLKRYSRRQRRDVTQLRPG